MKRVYLAITICFFASLSTLATSLDNDILYSTGLEPGGPTVAITLNTGQNNPTNGSPVVFKAVFSEAVTGFAIGDVTTSASTVGGTLTATVAEIAPNNGTTFTISVTGMTTAGNVVVTIAADVCSAAGPPSKLNQPSVNTSNTVAYDGTPPTAFTVGSVITTGGTVVAGRWNASNTGVDVTVPIDNDASLTGGSIQLQARVTTGSFANILTPVALVVGDLGTSKTISLTDAQFEAIASFGEGKIVEFRAVITDLVGNVTTGLTSATTITVDQILPAAFTVGSVVTTGGNIKAGYWNATNTGVNITVPIANDPTLNGGTVQLQARIASGTFASIGSPSAIAAINTTKVVTLTDAEFEAITGFADGETIQVRAIITDIAGNTTTGTQSATTILVDQNPPAAFTVGSVITTGGNNIAGYWNSTNTGVDVVVPTANDASLTGGGVQLQARVTSGTFASIGSVATILVGDLGNSRTLSLTSGQFEGITGFAEAEVIEIRAIITDIAGNTTTGTQSATTITVDQVGPTLTLTKPTASTFVNNTQVTYTISEPVSAATITWTRTGGTADSNHPQALTGAELTTNQTDYTLTNNPTLVNGSVYTVAFSSSDASGNTTTVSNTLVTYDTTPPSAPSTVSVTTTGGNVVTNYWNGSNTGVNLGINIPNDNSLINGTVQIEASSNGTTWNTIASSSSTTISSVNTTKTMSITSANILTISGYAQSVSLRFRARLIDQAGNGPSAFTISGTQLFVDTVKPTIVSADFFASLDGTNDPSFTDCNGTAISNTTSREFIHILMSETMAGANGTLPTIGSPGFAASTGVFDVGCSNRGASAYHPTNVIHLQDEFVSGSTDGAWDGNTTFSFTAGGTNVTDVAGNELASVPSIVPGDSNAPKLATGLIFLPNGTGPETIVFQFDETLNAAVTNNVTGFTTSVGTINTLLTNYNSITKTVTLTSSLNGMWTDAVTLSYDQATGNVTDPANNELVAFGGLSPNPAEPIFLKGVHISSNNTTNTAYAKVGNTITIGFTASRTLSALPIVTIGGIAANVALVSGSTYSATLVATAGVPDGPIAFQIDVSEANTATSVTATTDDSTIKFDKTSPTVVLSDDHADNIVRDADVVTITATFTELNGLNAIPTISISQTNPAITNVAMIATLNPLVWTYTWDVPAGVINDGIVNVTITSTDPAGNVNTAATGKNSYAIDNTAPTVTIATSSTLLGFGTNGTTDTNVNFLLTFSETIPNNVLAADISVNTGNDVNIFDAYPGVGFAPLVDGNITGSGMTRTVSVAGLSGTGWLKINLTDADNTVTDIAGNPAVDYSTSFTFPGTEAYTRVLSEPSNTITSPTTTRAGTTLTVKWTDAIAPTQQATHYLVMIKKTTVGSFPTVSDGTFLANDFDLTDNILKQNIPFGTTEAIFSGLTSTDGYDVIVYPYTISPNTGNSNINFGTATEISGTSDIIQNFNYAGNDNIPYKDFVETTLTSSSKTLEVFQLRDGGGSADADALPTILTGITLNVTNWRNLNQLGLFNGSTLVQQVATGPTVVFNSIGTTFQATDGGTAMITVKGSFNTLVDDNEVVTFSVSSVTASALNSSQCLTSTPTGATVTSDATGTQNKIEVTASKLEFTTIPPSATINVNFGPVELQARDVNNNIDLDFVSAVSAFGNNDALAMINTPFTPDPILSFAAGKLTLPGNLQFTAAPADGATQLSISAGGINNQLSQSIGVVSSQESILSYNSAAFTTTLPYITFQSSDITGAGNSAALATFILQDGNGVTPDIDGAPTKISSITFDITTTNNLEVTVAGSKDIRKIALYNASGLELGEQTLGSSTSVTFNIASAAEYITADDNLSTTFTIRATFLNDNANVRDLDNIKLKLTNVTQGSGSELNPLSSVTGGSWTKATGAVTNGQLTSDKKNIVDVVATKLQFIQQPSSVIGVNRPVPLPPGTPVKIVANDTNGLIDLEFNSANSSKLTLTVPTATPTAQLQTTSFAFTDGEVIIDPNTLVYTSAGDGTLTATSANNPPTATTVAPAVSNLVDVFDVTAVYSFGGVNTPSNIAGGSVNKIIYGVTFTAPFTRSGEPKLNSFVISFDNTITGVFKNPRVFEQKNNPTYSSIIAKNITDAAIKGKVTQGSFTFTVDFTGVGGVPRDFNANAGGTTYTYFLMVDVETTANSGTPPMQPYIEDLDWKFGTPGSLDPTAGNIVTSLGSTHALKTNTSGLTFSFAAIYPPSLIASNPSKGQLNVDPNGDIELTFDAPIWSLDATIELFQTTSVGTPGTKVGDLLLLGNPGRFDNSKLQTDPINVGNLSSTITFDVPAALAYNQIYYINVKKGTFDQTSSTGTGIMDKSGNKFPGIFSPGVLYFRTSSNLAPKLLSTGTSPASPLPTQIINVSLTGATIQASFDAPGNAYFMLTNNPTITPPTNDQIKGDVAYAGALTRGNFTISQTNPITQFGTINYALSNTQKYDIWMFAENSDLPTPVRTAGPYQGNFVASATPSSPTFTFTATNPAGTGIILYSPTYSICPGSYQPLNEPITIVERSTSDFNGTGSGIQTFNLLLPPGFEFQTSLPVNGKVILSSTADFIANSGSLSFLSNSVVQVSYTNANAPNTSIDNISISGLKILATGSASGSITRLGGTTLTAVNAIPDGTVIANIGTNTIDPISFTNSYLGDGTILPDLINDKFKTVQLIPSVPNGDYGASTFSGQGVTLDSLYLSSVTLGLPFNITISHTDNNGCVSENAIQYLVYDHRTGLGLAPSYCITNNYFPVPGTYPTTYAVFFNSFPGFYLSSLSTDVPVTVTNGSQYLDNTWSSVVQSLPVKTGTGFSPNDNPLPGTFYYNYTFDVRTINDKTGWYYFREFNSATGQDNPYYQGGSLGRVEYTGLYQSIANVALSDVKLVQSTQFFAPAVPYIEVSGNLSNGGVPVTNDPNNPFVASDFDPKNRPVKSNGYLPNLGNPGTFIFCEQGGDITINAYPAASGGTSVGKFTLVNHSTGNALVLDPDPASPGNFKGFKDNGNGVATLKPTVVNNGYNNIRIVYEYQDNNSPCKSIATLVIRITPNPVANFTTSILCEDIDISFTDTSTIPSATGVSIANAIWNYSDNKAVDNGDTIFYSSPRIPIHRYSDPGSYPNVSLNVITNYGCANVLSATKTLSVGGTPQVAFSFDGIATTDPITFTNASTVANDVVKQLDWSFGDGNGTSVTSNFGVPIINNYANAGSFKATLKVTSLIGCNANLSKTVIILPRIVPTGVSAYLATFETDDGGWQHAATAKPGFNTNDSWDYGKVDKTITQLDPFVNGTKAWATSLTGTFNSLERSALYSPSFDISQLSRPMVSFNSFVQFNSAEGVILQYSVDKKNVADSTKAWFVVGQKIGEGVDWFADQGIAAKPGDQSTNDFGWSGTNKVKWMESKHAIINEGTPKPDILGASRLVFRFAFATLNKAPDKEGFAMDNFRIGERTRTILLESFANTGNPAKALEKNENEAIRAFNSSAVGTEVVKINYHTGFPGLDPFNEDNPADNSSRALFYNITNTPDARLDGNYGGIPIIKPEFSEWGFGSFDQQTLKLADADIKIKPIISSEGITVNVDVRAINKIPKDSTVLFVAILEESIKNDSLSLIKQGMITTEEKTFEYVLKKMLPSAAGTVITTTDISQNSIKSFGPFTWKPDPTKFYKSNIGDLAIVVFLQNVKDKNKKVYQSEIVSNLTDPTINVITGLENVLPEHLNIFPNPASREFRIELPAIVQNEAKLHLIDITGRKYEKGMISSGSNSATVNVQDLSEGIYILEIGTANTGIIRKKVMVVMKN